MKTVKVHHAYHVAGRGLIWVVDHDNAIAAGSLVRSEDETIGADVMQVTGIETTSRVRHPMGLVIKRALQGDLVTESFADPRAASSRESATP